MAKKRGFTGAPQKGGSGETRSVRIPLFGGMSQRYGDTNTKDQSYRNCFFGEYKSPGNKESTYFLRARPGLAPIANQPTGATGDAKGIYYWSHNGRYYCIFGTQVYFSNVGTTITSWTNIGITLTGTAKPCGISEIRSGATPQQLCINDGARLYCIDTANVVTTVTTNFPSPNTGDLVYLDGYLFVLKQDATVWNCSLDDPLTWSPTTFITAQMGNGDGVALARQGNMIVVLGSDFIQCFFNAGNPAPASPLQNVEQLYQQVGCADRATLVDRDNRLIWMSLSTSGFRQLWKLENLSKLDTISDSFVQKTINSTTNSGSSGFLIEIENRPFYVLNLPSTNQTLVYDIDMDLWVRWTAAGSDGRWTGGTFLQAADAKLSPLVQDYTNGKIYSYGVDIYQDDGVPFKVLCRLNKLDFGSTKRKFYSCVEVVGDNSSFPTSFSISYSDDDYVTFSTPRTIQGQGAARSYSFQWGSSRRRGWQIEFDTFTVGPRLEALEITVDEDNR